MKTYEAEVSIEVRFVVPALNAVMAGPLAEQRIKAVLAALPPGIKVIGVPEYEIVEYEETEL